MRITIFFVKIEITILQTILFDFENKMHLFSISAKKITVVQNTPPPRVYDTQIGLSTGLPCLHKPWTLYRVAISKIKIQTTPKPHYLHTSSVSHTNPTLPLHPGDRRPGAAALAGGGVSGLAICKGCAPGHGLLQAGFGGG